MHCALTLLYIHPNIKDSQSLLFCHFPYLPYSSCFLLHIRNSCCLLVVFFIHFIHCYLLIYLICWSFYSFFTLVIDLINWKLNILLFRHFHVHLIVLFVPGGVFVIETLDYETAHEFYLTVEATDGGTPRLSDMATVNINLTDVNDNSPIFNQDIYSAVISEDAELGKIVLTVSHPASLSEALLILLCPAQASVLHHLLKSTQSKEHAHKTNTAQCQTKAWRPTPIFNL